MHSILNNSPVNRFERRRQRTRDALQQSAIALILEKGYDAVSVQDITDHADLGRGTFYIYFNDKEDLIWQALRVSFDEIIATLKNAQQDKTPTMQEYCSWLTTFEHAGQQRDLYRILLGGKGLATLQQRIRHYLIEHIQSEIETGNQYPILSHLPSKLIAEFIVGALLQVLEGWLEEPNGVSAQQLADQFYEMVWRQPLPKS